VCVQKNAGLAYHEDYRLGEKIAVLDLEERGYRLTSRFVVVNNEYKIFELLPLDDLRPAQKCFLALNGKLPGVIVDGAFNEHKAVLNSSENRSPRSIRILREQPLKQKKRTWPGAAGAKSQEPARQFITTEDARYYCVEY
jgi:hypothetical protein